MLTVNKHHPCTHLHFFCASYCKKNSTNAYISLLCQKIFNKYICILLISRVTPQYYRKHIIRKHRVTQLRFNIGLLIYRILCYVLQHSQRILCYWKKHNAPQNVEVVQLIFLILEFRPCFVALGSIQLGYIYIGTEHVANDTGKKSFETFWLRDIRQR